MPCGIVDMNILTKNVERFAKIAATHGKTIRLATKSVRVPDLIRHILKVGGKNFKGLMCYGITEAVFLAAEGFDDLLVAYPSVQGRDLDAACKLTQAGTKIILMIDEVAHVDAIKEVWQKQNAIVPARVCIDVDASYRPFGLFHLGVRRSPIRNLSELRNIVGLAKGAGLQIVGLMAYEAQIAGLADRNPTAPFMNLPKSFMKWLSRRELAKRRAAMATLMGKEGIQLEFYNGGGSGSVASTSKEECITEVAAGSGFLQSQLFDYYRDNINEPAFCFGLRVSRIPEAGMVTCQSGGFIASGETSVDKSPKPFLPEGLKPFSTEGFGEVQTPLSVPSDINLVPGDPVFLRPAKAGEIAERFNEYILKQDDKIIGRAKTYRGLGHCSY